MKNNALTLVLKNDWITSSAGNTYTGKYTVGRFHLTDAFIVEYMKLIHGIEIPDSWVSSSFTNISDTDTRKIMYMEGCDMLSKDVMNEIRKSVKSPSDDVKIYRTGNHVTKIELMDERNEITL
ncbi:TPA: hypothetical protein ACOELX_003950 [Enterobacter roggenkampii]|uniref:hypothetical protein n=1 Tax=Enterobacteriaceae TaxID=543 RepID=UPI001CBC4F43|nr:MULTISPECIES: hypothetical protein [Enterobacteriaceae]MBZ3799712.1 hypothetical protein [Leclercia adecarboxylata]MBZ3805221.1 hypothetical protein [Leclercia adecarboxylata]WEY55406.1 hypothetical protein P3S52_11280 [Enterobacter roggenkampii]